MFREIEYKFIEFSKRLRSTIISRFIRKKKKEGSSNEIISTGRRKIDDDLCFEGVKDGMMKNFHGADRRRKADRYEVSKTRTGLFTIVSTSNPSRSELSRTYTCLDLTSPLYISITRLHV